MATRSDAAIDDEPNTAHTTTTTATTSDIHRPNLTVQQAQEPPVLGQQEGTEQVLPAQAGEQSRSEQPEQQQQQQQAGLARPLVPGLQPGQSRAEGLEGGAHVRRKVSRDQSPSMGHNPGSGATTSAVPGAADPLLASTAGGCALRQQTGSTMGSGAGILQAIPAQQTDVQAQREAGKHARQASTMSHHLAEQPDLKRSRKDDATMQQPGHQTFGLEGAISEKQHHASGNPIAVQQAEAARRAKAALELFNAQQVSMDAPNRLWSD
ncbi:MAG: hypothetical protein WDW38_003200 [Sanguina aurantia]